MSYAYGMRFPTYEEYRRFLERNLAREFPQGNCHECAMSVLTNHLIGEGHGSDFDLLGPDWFHEHERRCLARGMWTGTTTGQDILNLLLELDPDGCYPRVCQVDRKNDWTTLDASQTVEFDGWRIRMDRADQKGPGDVYLANMAAGTSRFFEAGLDPGRQEPGRLILRRPRGPDRWIPAGQSSLCPLGKVQLPVLETNLTDGGGHVCGKAIVCVIGVGPDQRFQGRRLWVRAFQLARPN